MNHTVSVVMPTYNGERYIGEAIESALIQSLTPYEIIVVDDGSTDNTKKIVSKFGRRVQYVFQENAGTATAYNTGISMATGEYLAFLEHDDLWEANKNAMQVNFLAHHHHFDFGLVYSHVTLLKEDKQSKYNDINYQDEAGEYGFRDFFIRNRILNCSSVMLRRSVINEIGFFRSDLTLAFDYDLWLRVASRFRIICLDQAMVKYRIHESNQSRDSKEFAAAEGSLKTMLYWFNDPLANRLLGKRTVRDRVARLHHRIAWAYAMKGFRDDELRHLWSAVLVDPLSAKNINRYLWRSLSPSFRKHIEWYWAKIKSLKL